MCNTFDEDSDKLGPATVASEESTDLIYLDWAESIERNLHVNYSFSLPKWYSSDKVTFSTLTVRYTIARFWSFTTGPLKGFAVSRILDFERG